MTNLKGIGAIGGNLEDGVQFTITPSNFANPIDAELSLVKAWSYNTFGVQDIVNGNFYMQNPVWLAGLNQNWNVPTGTDRYDISNLYELLDAPGEFYYNRVASANGPANTMYYIPRTGETMGTAEAIAPVVEGLVRIQGSGLNSRVRNLQFWGITFAHDSWLMVKMGDSYGATTPQSNAVFYKVHADGNWHEDDYGECTVIRGAVLVNFAENIHFERNTFTHCGGIGISYVNAVSNSNVIGNRFIDLSSSGINIGHPQHVFLNGTTPVVPCQFRNCHDPNSLVTDEYAGVEEQPKNIVVSNNYHRENGVEFGSGPGISLYFAEKATVAHNDVGKQKYCGLSIGWGWVNQRASTTGANIAVNYNRINGACQGSGDGGGLYTIGTMSGSNPRTGNYVFCDGSKDDWNYGTTQTYTCRGMNWALYADEGFTNGEFYENVIEDHEQWMNSLRDETTKWHDNYSNSASSSIRTTQANYANYSAPTVFAKGDYSNATVKRIIDNAGLEAAYKQPWNGVVRPGVISTLKNPGNTQLSSSSKGFYTVRQTGNRFVMHYRGVNDEVIQWSVADMAGRIVNQSIGHAKNGIASRYEVNSTTVGKGVFSVQGKTGSAVFSQRITISQ